MSKGVCVSLAEKRLLLNLLMTVYSVGTPSSSSKAATGTWKSRAFARPLEPMGPSSGSS